MEIISDQKVAVTINGQTIFVTPQEAAKLKKQLQATTSIAVEQPSPASWHGQSLILG
jgi:hypothetical protein